MFAVFMIIVALVVFSLLGSMLREFSGVVVVLVPIGIMVYLTIEYPVVAALVTLAAAWFLALLVLEKFENYVINRIKNGH